MAFEGTEYVGMVKLADTLTFSFTTRNTSGVPTDIDASFTKQVRQGATINSSATVTVTSISGKDGAYYVSISATAAKGFSVGKWDLLLDFDITTGQRRHFVFDVV